MDCSVTRCPNQAVTRVFFALCRNPESYCQYHAWYYDRRKGVRRLRWKRSAVRHVEGWKPVGWR